MVWNSYHVDAVMEGIKFSRKLRPINKVLENTARQGKKRSERAVPSARWSLLNSSPSLLTSHILSSMVTILAQLLDPDILDVFIPLSLLPCQTGPRMTLITTRSGMGKNLQAKNTRPVPGWTGGVSLPSIFKVVSPSETLWLSYPLHSRHTHCFLQEENDRSLSVI
jgi:hypothetical protein